MKNEQIREIINMLADSCKDYVPKVAEYEIHSSTMWVVVWAVVIVLSLIAIIATYRYRKWQDEFAPIMICAIATTMLIVGIFGIASQINDIYIAKYLPEKMFIHYLESVIENGL